ncbi:MAG: hypothetical protein WCD53_17045 [Microcoleus sp.]
MNPEPGDGAAFWHKISAGKQGLSPKCFTPESRAIAGDYLLVIGDW